MLPVLSKRETNFFQQEIEWKTKEFASCFGFDLRVIVTQIGVNRINFEF